MSQLRTIVSPGDIRARKNSSGSAIGANLVVKQHTVQDECRLGTDRNVDVDWFGEVGGRGKMLIEHKGKPFLINLSLLFRRGVPAVLGYDSLCLSKGQLGPREGQSTSLGTTRR